MLNSKSLKSYKCELDMIINKIKDDTYLAEDYLNVLKNPSNIDSKLTGYLDAYSLDFEDDMHILLKKCEVINNNFEQILNRRLRAEASANDVLNELDKYNFKGGSY